VRSTIQPRAEFKIVAEAVDGLEAVEKAKLLQPDLILLDIDLPKLNGIGAAQQIRVLAPDAKLLFMTLEISAAMMVEVFRVGARGYIHKLPAQFDLLPAIDAVLAGKQFVSSLLDLVDGANAQRQHEVHFYSDETLLLERVSRFVAHALKVGGAAIVLTTPAHGESVVQSLKADAIDVDAAIQQGTYISLDTVEALSRIVVNNAPDLDRFSELLGSIIESCRKATEAHRARIAVYGECCGLLCADSNCDAAIQLEKKGNDLLEAHNIDIMCAYPLKVFQGSDHERAFRTICAEHTSVFLDRPL
jgi:CheY-like chemotaxis protein